jgi:hypothetical protein
MTPQDLQRAFDGEAGAQDVAGHVAGCAPCNSALELLQTQRDAVHYLSEPAGDQPPQAAVEHILAESARAGRERLADLLYELAKACLIVLPDLKRRVERRVEPRDAPIVSGELRAINSRLDDADASIDVTPVPQTTPEEDRALGVARSCLTILENVEGKTERCCLGLSQVSIFDGRPEVAEQLLSELLSSGQFVEHRDYAFRNYSHSLLRQRKYEEVVTVGEEALREFPRDGMLLFNVAVALAYLKDKQQFREYSRAVGKIITDDSATWLLDLVRFEVPRIAGEFQTSESEIADCFELSCESGEVTS